MPARKSRHGYTMESAILLYLWTAAAAMCETLLASMHPKTYVSTLLSFGAKEE